MTAKERDDIKCLDIKEFVRLGLLQEVNRLFFHPRGLALEIQIHDGEYRMARIWDYRNDPEGIVFNEASISSVAAQAKAQQVASMLEAHEEVRKQLFGGEVVQPLRTATISIRSSPEAESSSAPEPPS